MLAVKFLTRVDVIDQKSANLFPLTSQESAAKLLNGDIDASFLMGAWETPAVQQLLAENRPPRDVLLMAPKASLIVREDLHPAIQYQC